MKNNGVDRQNKRQDGGNHQKWKTNGGVPQNNPKNGDEIHNRKWQNHQIKPNFGGGDQKLQINGGDYQKWKTAK